MSADSGRLYRLAADLLAILGVALEGQATDPPARQYVANGQVAIDGEQLVVAVEQVRTGMPGVPTLLPLSVATTVTADLVVHLYRCVPQSDEDGDPPGAEALDASAEQILTDGTILTDTVIAAFVLGDTTPPLDRCTAAVLVSSLPYGPEGGYGGWQVRLSVQL